VLARDDELLRWQHARPDNPERLSVLVAEEAGRLVGMLGLIEFDACIRSRRARGAWMTTWLVEPDARGRGIGRALVEQTLATEYDFVGALAANEATRHVLHGLGFAEVGMYRWVRVLDVDGLRELLRGRDVPDEAWAAWAESSPATETAPPAQGFVGACRDGAFLERRYGRHPRFDYRVVRTEQGVAARRIETVRGTDLRVMRIVDLLAGPELAEQLATEAEREAVVFVDFACTSPRFGLPLEAAGFAREDRLPSELPSRFQPLDFSERPIVSCFWACPGLGVDFFGGDLYVTRADSDLDRPN
jgi:GNAT superfamily N-acetyltransferase